MHAQDLVVLGVELRVLMPYLIVLVVGFCVGGLFVLRTIKSEELKGWGDRLRYIVWGVGSSMLTTWLSFEIIGYYFKLPLGLATAISGGIGYMGAEVIGELGLKAIAKKLGVDREDKDKHA
ncbi:phage holin family protein [Helicobacter salomonis]|uniref:holin n=1 Tax=Helicobacter salomonis TaxID=56878 RepID=UPI000CF0ADA1|nr:holin [Helicobacter salomonis]